MNPKTDASDVTKGSQDEELLENARIAYRVAVQLWTYEGTAAWNRFNVMLVANSILVGVAASALVSNARTEWLLWFPIAGIALCAPWWAILRRGMGYQFHYTYSARCLEELLHEPMRTVRDGRKLSEGESVTYSDRPGDTHTMSDLGRVKMRYAAFFVILVFLVVNLAMLWTMVPALCPAPK